VRSLSAKLGLGVTATALILIVVYAVQQLGGERRQVPTTRPLRLTAQQALLSWQSFPGRYVAIEYCTLQTAADGRLLCRIFDGSREAGFVLLERSSIDAKSAEWMIANCSTQPPSRDCTVRVSGTLRKGTDGRPVLEEASVDRS
jgi:hypothetical protein